MIIGKRQAQRLIKAGQARIETELKPDDRGRIYVAITRFDIQRTDHYAK